MVLELLTNNKYLHEAVFLFMLNVPIHDYHSFLEIHYELLATLSTSIYYIEFLPLFQRARSRIHGNLRESSLEPEERVPRSLRGFEVGVLAGK